MNAILVNPHEAKTLRSALLTWYKKNQRDLPWRGHPDPYAILVSEFMLQQTQVTTVLPYYERFLSKFPTPKVLAGASEDSVRAAWSGLGYYRRARSLQAAAQSMLRDHQGGLPDTMEALRRLPGVGSYTAAALGSIVHDLPHAVVDGNVIRVLTRFYGISTNVSRSQTHKRLQELADGMLDPRVPGDWNQAMMELGAMVCTSRKPDCHACPWETSCRARQTGNPEQFPVKDRAKPTQNVVSAVGVVRRKGQFLLTRRHDTKLLDGTWEFPGIEIGTGIAPATALVTHLKTCFPGTIQVAGELARVKHAITHRRIVVQGYAATVNPAPRTKRNERVWVDVKSLENYPVSSMTAKLIRKLTKIGGTP